MRYRNTRIPIIIAVLGAMTALVIGSQAWASPGGKTEDEKPEQRERKVQQPAESHTGQDQVPPDGDTGSSPDGEDGTAPPGGDPTLDDELVCGADVTKDGVVDVDDLIEVILNWGVCDVGGTCPGDTNLDGVVDVADLVEVIVGWGPCP